MKNGEGNFEAIKMENSGVLQISALYDSGVVVIVVGERTVGWDERAPDLQLLNYRVDLTFFLITSHYFCIMNPGDLNARK